MKPVLCCGEILIDFIAVDVNKSLFESGVFEKKAGGAPFNVAVGVRRLGRPVSFLGKLGGDQFSQFLLSQLQQEDISIEHVKVDRNLKATLAFVARDTEGNPDFVFFRENPADANLALKDVEDVNPEDFSLIHVGSVSMIFDPSRKTFMELVERFASLDLSISYDPNVRPSLITNRKRFVEDFLFVSSKTSIVKLSDKDMGYIFPGTSLHSAIRKVPLKEGAALFVTRGAEGCTILYEDQMIEVPSFKVNTVDTTGCGDAFMAGLIYKATEQRFCSVNDVRKAAVFANAVAALVATRIGAAGSMPHIEEVEGFLREHSTNETAIDGFGSSTC